MEVYYKKDEKRVYGTAVGFYGTSDKGYAVLCMQDGTFEFVDLTKLYHTAVTARNTN